jgi:hypothetical protein
MKQATLLMLATLATACVGPPTGPAPRYIGTATPTTPGPLCPASTASAQVREGQIVFAPDEGTWLLDGLVNKDGTTTADKTRPGVNKQPWETTFIGKWTPFAMNGTYKTPRCTYTVALTAR